MLDVRLEGWKAKGLRRCYGPRRASKERTSLRRWISALEWLGKAVRWPSVDLGNGNYDWSTVKAVQDAATACKITPIWDLCHYGFPDGCDPFSQECLEQICWLLPRRCEVRDQHGRRPLFFTPMNEITFFSAAASDLQWMYPFAKGREGELKRALARMAIEGAKAIREIEPGARMVHVDPIVHVRAATEPSGLGRRGLGRRTPQSDGSLGHAERTCRAGAGWFA